MRDDRSRKSSPQVWNDSRQTQRRRTSALEILGVVECTGSPPWEDGRVSRPPPSIFHALEGKTCSLAGRSSETMAPEINRRHKGLISRDRLLQTRGGVNFAAVVNPL